MKKAIVYADSDNVNRILDGANPNYLLFADAETCFDSGAEEAQAMAIVKLCDLERLEHKLKTINGISQEG